MKDQKEGIDFPLVDFHVHLEGDITLERAVQLSKERGVQFGIVEHGGRGETIGDDVALLFECNWRERHPTDTQVVSDLKQSVAYWREYVKD